MPKIKNKFFVVTLIFEIEVKMYFVREELQPLGSRGIFSRNIAEAHKFRNEFQANWFASGYKGAHVECIKSGERLKGGC